MTRIAPAWLSAAPVRRILAALAPADPHFVGGCVRDALMGRETADLDIAVITPPEETMRLAKAAGIGAHPTGVDHGVVTLVANGQAVEAATLRRDVATDGRRAVVAFSLDRAEDAARRDFTLNALYADAAGRVEDPLGAGLADLQARRVRFIGDARMRLREDFLRILRFYRFHAQLELSPIDTEGDAACQAERAGLARIASERIGAEMKKLLSAPDPGPALKAMGPILDDILPGAVWPGGLVAAEAALDLSPDPIRRLAALWTTDTTRLRLSRAEAAQLAALAEATAESPEAAAYRRGAEVALSAEALRRAAGAAPTTDARKRIAAARPCPVAAKDLIAAGWAPGPELGAALSRIEEAWIASRFTATRSDLLASPSAAAEGRK